MREFCESDARICLILQISSIDWKCFQNWVEDVVYVYIYDLSMLTNNVVYRSRQAKAH